MGTSLAIVVVAVYHAVLKTGVVKIMACVIFQAKITLAVIRAQIPTGAMDVQKYVHTVGDMCQSCHETH